MTAVKLADWDTAEILTTPERIAAYLEEVLAENDPAMITHALGVIARARGMSQLARDTGLTREGLYKALSMEGNPEFITVIKVINALGIRLHATAN